MKTGIHVYLTNILLTYLVINIFWCTEGGGEDY